MVSSSNERLLIITILNACNHNDGLEERLSWELVVIKHLSDCDIQKHSTTVYKTDPGLRLKIIWLSDSELYQLPGHQFRHISMKSFSTTNRANCDADSRDNMVETQV